MLSINDYKPEQFGLDEIYVNKFLYPNALFIFPKEIDYTIFKYLIDFGYSLVVNTNSPKKDIAAIRICDRYSLNELSFDQIIAISEQQKSEVIRILKWKLIQNTED